MQKSKKKKKRTKKRKPLAGFELGTISLHCPVDGSARIWGVRIREFECTYIIT